MSSVGIGQERIRVPLGLDGVVLCETGISEVDGRAGTYRYRDYEAVELARKRPLEDVWCLLLNGRLPDAVEAVRFREELASIRDLPLGLAELLGSVASLSGPSGDLMISLRSAGSLLGELFALQPMVDLEVEEVRGQALRICAISPTIAAALSRLAEGKPLVSPDPRLGVAANYLYMLHGNAPDPLHAQLLEQYMVLAADHEMGAGTLAARVVASTGADLGSAMLAGLCALSGPLHGGAPHRALRMLDEIGVPDRTDAWLAENMERGGRVPGFGHRVYRTPDPRAVALRELSRQLGGDRLTLAERVEERVTAFLEREKPGRDLQVNVEFYAAVLMAELGIPANLFSTTFALARLPGWGAHILEQLEHNRLIRPLTEFKGGPLVSVPEVG